ncbi:MAG: IS1595 family transposase [Maritimibacter sp.]|nr:IS1595 family transposase [Maritimibacter sp.]
MNLTDPIFTDKDAAREYLERQRWADGVYCPHCGGTEKCKKLSGKSHRPGLYQCGDCRKQFTVTVGTVFERSKVPLNKWLLATFLMASSKKGISAHQLHRTIGVTYKTAWFMFHRIREAMNAPGGIMGGGGGSVEVDETFIGKDKTARTDVRKFNYLQKNKVLTLVDRDTRTARSVVIKDLKVATIRPILLENIAREARVVTDEAPRLKGAADGYAHETVNHGADEYVRGDVTTNTVENYFSVFKRGMRGVYQHCGQQHLHRYLAEFDFRYNHRAAKEIDDTMRANAILKGAEGKRLTYRRADSVLA